MAKKFHRDVWVGTVLLIFCIAVFFTAVQIPGQASYLPITLSLLMGLHVWNLQNLLTRILIKERYTLW